MHKHWIDNRFASLLDSTPREKSLESDLVWDRSNKTRLFEYDETAMTTRVTTHFDTNRESFLFFIGSKQNKARKKSASEVRSEFPFLNLRESIIRYPIVRSF